MRKKIIGIVAVVIIVALSYFGFVTYKRMTRPKEVHFHAGFVVFRNDKKLDFSDFRYMEVKPCTEDKNHKDSDADIQAEKAHLHDFVGDVVHVEREGALWRDLFTNIRYKLNYPDVTAYVNGKKAGGFENLKIQPDDSLVVLIGNNSNNHLRDAVKKDYIEEKAKKSVDCD